MHSLGRWFSEWCSNSVSAFLAAGSSSGGGFDEATLGQIAALDQSAFTFTSLESALCAKTKRKSLGGAQKPATDVSHVL